MIIKRTCPFSGEPKEMDLPVTQEQMDAFEAGNKVQHVFPNLTASQREFILTGITDDQWDKTFNNGFSS